MAPSDQAPLTQDEVVGVLAQALALSGDPERQYTELSRVRRFLDHTSGLIPAIIGVVRPLIDSQHAWTRKWYAEFIDLAITTPQISLDSRTPLALQSLDDLLRLLTDQQASVRKVAIQGCASAYPIIFRHVCHRPADQSQWDIMNTIKRKVMEAWEDANDGIKVSVCKFVQRTILVQSKAIADPRLQNRADISLNLCPTNHPYLKAATLEQEGIALLDVLLNSMHSSGSASLLTAIINSIVIIFKMRPSLQGKIVTSIMNWTPAALANATLSQIRSVEKSLRIHMNNILKTGLGGNHAPQLHQAMQQQAARMDIIMKAAREGMEGRKRKIEAQRAPEEVKRTRVDSANLFGVLPADSPLAHFDVTSLPLNLVVECIIATLISTASDRLDAAIQMAQARLREMDNGQGQPAAQSHDIAATEILDFKQEADEEDEEELDFQLDAVNEHLQSRNEQLGQTNEAAADGDIDRSPPPSPTTLDQVTAAFETRPFELPPPPELTEEQRLAERADIVESLIEVARVFLQEEAEGDEQLNKRRQLSLTQGMTTSVLASMVAGDNSLQKCVSLMVRLATVASGAKHIKVKEESKMQVDKEQQDPIRRALFDLVMEDFRERMPVALQWMNEEWFYGSDLASHYDLWLERILERLVPTLESREKVFSKFLLHLPSVPESALVQLKGLCLDPDRMQLGFSTLRVLINYRPPLRASCLDILLDFCVDKDKSTRSAAIITVKKWYPNTDMSSRIQQFAALQLGKIVAAVTKEDPGAESDADEASNLIVWTENEVTRQMELYFVLCTKEHDLLDGILEVYKQCTVNVQRIVRKQLAPVAKAIGRESTKLRELVQEIKNLSEAAAPPEAATESPMADTNGALQQVEAQ